MPVKLNPTHILSLGAGVQSSTLALMATKGIISPMPHSAVFADTHAEPPAVYSWLDWLEQQLAFPVVRVSAGSLIDAVLTEEHYPKRDRTFMKRVLPVFYSNQGKTGMGQRRCTRNHKIFPIRQYSHTFIKSGVVQWIGISTDEASRMRDSEVKYIANRYPLIELGMSRTNCLQWMQENGYPEPPKSSCIFCPFHSDEYWLELQRNDSVSFQVAVELEREVQRRQHSVGDTEFIGYFHRSMVPLDQVEFRHRAQPSLFENDCSGSCGV